MISAYVVIPVVFGIVLTYLWLIHRFWLRSASSDEHKPSVPTRVVILGGGFGGLHSALHFEKTIAADPTIEVTLVSRENFALFTPMLHEVAAGDLEMSAIVTPLRKMLKRVRFLEADVDNRVNTSRMCLATTRTPADHRLEAVRPMSGHCPDALRDTNRSTS